MALPTNDASQKLGQNLGMNAANQPHNSTGITDKNSLRAVLQFLRQNNYQNVEELLKKESKITDQELEEVDGKQPTQSQVSQALLAYKSEDDPSRYEDAYAALVAFVDKSLDVHKVELSIVLYPVLVHMYLELIFNGHEIHAQQLYQRFAGLQEEHRHDDLKRLATVTKKEHILGNRIMEDFQSNEFTIDMSRDSYTHLKRFMQDSQLSLLLKIVQERLFIDVFDGVPRTRQQVLATSGGQMGEARRDANKAKVYFGLLKEPDLNIPMEEEDDGDDDKPKKKKQKKDPLLMKKSKNDPNAPPNTRIPLPELKDADKLEKIQLYREAVKRVKLDRENPPSTIFYTILNSHTGVTAVDFTDDSSMLSVGFHDSTVRVWSLTQNKLRCMKDPKDLELIDKDADDVLERMMDERTASDNKLLVGHSGPVYATSFSPDRKLLLSSSEDGTVRLWSLHTWTSLVSYKGHNYPVWDVKFSPYGHYFVSGGMDRTARLWSTDHYQSLRVFAGHYADVDSVMFHPNCNYVATGSYDKTVRLWDVSNGQCVRIMSGHKDAVHCLAFSPDGKYLASAGVDTQVLLWDIGSGTMVAQMQGHTATVYSLCFSREGSLLASGGHDNTVRLWDINKVMEDQDTDADTSIPSAIQINDSSELLVDTYHTKNTPVLGLHFSRRNLLYATGGFQHN